MRLAAGLFPDPLGELKRSPNPLAAKGPKGGLLLRGGEGKEKRGGEGKGRGKGRDPPYHEILDPPLKADVTLLHARRRSEDGVRCRPFH